MADVDQLFVEEGRQVRSELRFPFGARPFGIVLECLLHRLFGQQWIEGARWSTYHQCRIVVATEVFMPLLIDEPDLAVGRTDTDTSMPVPCGVIRAGRTAR